MCVYVCVHICVRICVIFLVSRLYPTIDEIDIFLNVDVQCILDVRTSLQLIMLKLLYLHRKTPRVPGE